MRPLIGITTSVNLRDYETLGQSVVMVPESYSRAVKEAGGIPLLISECEDAEELLDVLDGLIISGGRDINPSLYGEELHEKTIDINEQQDEWEKSLIEGAIERDMPLLCICRGHQLLCAIRGGKLFQHLPTTKGFEKHGETGGKSVPGRPDQVCRFKHDRREREKFRAAQRHQQQGAVEYKRP